MTRPPNKDVSRTKAQKPSASKSEGTKARDSKPGKPTGSRPIPKSGKAGTVGDAKGKHRPGRSSRGGKKPGKRDENLRLFYAVFVPDALKPALEAAQTKLVGRWWKKVEVEHFHITLLFIGGVPDGALERFKTVGRTISGDIPEFTAQFRGTGFFPNEGSPRVWFAKAEGEGFKTLAEALRDGLSDVIADAEPFKPHVTLARKKGSSPRPPPIVIGLEFPVTHFALVESSLTKSGPQYKILENFALAPAQSP